MHLCHVNTAAHKKEIDQIKSDFNISSSKSMASEIQKLKQSHIGELDRAKKDIDSYYAKKMDELKREISKQKSMEFETEMKRMKLSHARDLEQMRAEVTQFAKVAENRELERVASIHNREMENLRSEMEAKIARSVKQEVGMLTKAHNNAIEMLKADLKAASVAENLRLQTMANEQRSAAVERETQKLKQVHEQEMARLKNDMIAMANSSESEKMQMLQNSQHLALEQAKAQMEASYYQMLEDELAKMKYSHELEMQRLTADMQSAALAETKRLQIESSEMASAEVARVTDELKKAHKAEMAKSMDQVNRNANSSRLDEIRRLEAKHKIEMERVQLDMKTSAAQALAVEIKKLKDSHAAEVAVIRNEMLSNAGSSYESKIEKLNASFNAELERVKASAKLDVQRAQMGKDAPSQSWGLQGGMNKSENIDSVLSSLQGVYPADHIEQLKRDLIARDEELERLNINIAESARQMTVLESQLDTSKSTETSLSEEIKNLNEWKRNAQADIQSKTKEIQGAKTELERLKKERRGSYRASEEVVQLEKEIRKKNNEIIGLNTTIKSMTKEVSNLQLKFEAALRENNSMSSEISELKEWKQRAIVERKKENDALESNVTRLRQELDNLKKSHQKEISKIEGKLRDEISSKKSSVEHFASELNSKNNEMKQLQDNLVSKDGEIKSLKSDLRYRNEDVDSLVPEVARLQALSSTLQETNDAHTKEFAALKSKNDELVAKLEVKNNEIAKLENIVAERTKKVADLESKLDSISVANNKAMVEIGSLKDYRSTAEKTIEGNNSVIASMKVQYEQLQKELANGKSADAAKTAKLQELEKKMQTEVSVRSEDRSRFDKTLFGKDGEIEQLKRDLSARSLEIADLKLKIEQSNQTNKKLSSDIAEFKRSRYSSEELLKKQSGDVQRLTSDIQSRKEADAAKIKDLEKKYAEQIALYGSQSKALAGKDSELAELRKGLASKSDDLTRLQSGANTVEVEKVRLLREVTELSNWKKAAEITIKKSCDKIDQLNAELVRLQNELRGADAKSMQSVEMNEVLKERNNLIRQLADVKEEVIQRGEQIKHAKMSTDTLLKRDSLSSQPDSPRAAESGIATGGPVSTYQHVDRIPKQTTAVSSSPARASPSVIGEFGGARRTSRKIEQITPQATSDEKVSSVTGNLSPNKPSQSPGASNWNFSSTIDNISSLKAVDSGNVFVGKEGTMVTGNSRPDPMAAYNQAISNQKAFSFANPPASSENEVVASKDEKKAVNNSVSFPYSSTDNTKGSGKSPPKPDPMAAYDQALLAQKAASSTDSTTITNSFDAVNRPAATSAERPGEISSGPMSGWAGYKNSRWGGYLDNLSTATNPDPKALTTGAQTAAPINDGIGDAFRLAEKNLLMEAKTWAKIAGESFVEARAIKERMEKGDEATNKYNDGIKAREISQSLRDQAGTIAAANSQRPDTMDAYEVALEKARNERSKVDELLAKANEMRAKAEGNVKRS